MSSTKTYAITEPVYHGRFNKDKTVLAGRVSKVKGGWQNDQSSNIHKRQHDAAKALMAIVFPQEA